VRSPRALSASVCDIALFYAFWPRRARDVRCPPCDAFVHRLSHFPFVSLACAVCKMEYVRLALLNIAEDDYERKFFKARYNKGDELCDFLSDVAVQHWNGVLPTALKVYLVPSPAKGDPRMDAVQDALKGVDLDTSAVLGEDTIPNTAYLVAKRIGESTLAPLPPPTLPHTCAPSYAHVSPHRARARPAPPTMMCLGSRLFDACAPLAPCSRARAPPPPSCLQVLAAARRLAAAR